MKIKKMAITATTLAMVFTGAIAVNASEVDTEDQERPSAETRIEMQYEKAEDALEAGDITQDEYDEMIAHIETMVAEGLDGERPEHEDGEGRGMGMGERSEGGIRPDHEDGDRALGNRDKSEDGTRPEHDDDGEGRGMGLGDKEAKEEVTE